MVAVERYKDASGAFTTYAVTFFIDAVNFPSILASNNLGKQLTHAETMETLLHSFESVVARVGIELCERIKSVEQIDKEAAKLKEMVSQFDESINPCCLF